MSSREAEGLYAVYERLIESEAFNGSHVSLDRDTRGEEYVAIAPDWIDGTGLRLVVALASEHELNLALTKDGLRLEPHTGETVRGVDEVKRILAGEDDPDA